MATVIADMSMSLDGFIADRHDKVGPLFDWYFGGPVATPTADPRWTFHTSAASAAALRGFIARVGALVCGRRIFDLTNGWGGHHPVGCPVFVVTHTVPAGWPRADAPFTFVTEGGVARAVALASAAAGDRIVAVATPSITQQCLALGLLDEIRVNLVPVLLGDGIRFFEQLQGTPILLDDPEVTTSTRVTHLHYRVRRHV
jgi:dihydrofolate reductase